jgi:hypothetical protein
MKFCSKGGQVFWGGCDKFAQGSGGRLEFVIIGIVQVDESLGLDF